MSLQVRLAALLFLRSLLGSLHLLLNFSSFFPLISHTLKSVFSLLSYQYETEIEFAVMLLFCQLLIQKKKEDEGFFGPQGFFSRLIFYE